MIFDYCWEKVQFRSKLLSLKERELNIFVLNGLLFNYLFIFMNY